MGRFKTAAERSFKRNLCIYGREKVMRLAIASGYQIDADGNVLSVKDEEEAFASLCEVMVKELGPLAVLSCKAALIKISSQETKEIMQQLADESLAMNSVVYALQNSVLVFKSSGFISETKESVASNSGVQVKKDGSKNNRMLFERPHPVSIFFKRVFS